MNDKIKKALEYLMYFLLSNILTLLTVLPLAYFSMGAFSVWYKLQPFLLIMLPIVFSIVAVQLMLKCKEKEFADRFYCFLQNQLTISGLTLFIYIISMIITVNM